MPSSTVTDNVPILLNVIFQKIRHYFWIKLKDLEERLMFKNAKYKLNGFQPPVRVTLVNCLYILSARLTFTSLSDSWPEHVCQSFSPFCLH